MDANDTILMVKSAKNKNDIIYITEYSKLRRHIDYFLGQALSDIYSPLSLEEIRDKIKDQTSIRLGINSLKKDLERFSKKHGENLLCQVGDRYRLNHCLYNYAKIKPPRNYIKDV